MLLASAVTYANILKQGQVKSKIKGVISYIHQKNDLYKTGYASGLGQILRYIRKWRQKRKTAVCLARQDRFSLFNQIILETMNCYETLKTCVDF